MKDAAQDVAEDFAEDVPQDVAQDLAFWARAARALPPPPPLPSLRSLRLAEMGAQLQLGSSVAFGSGCGLALTGGPRKAPLC